MVWQAHSQAVSYESHKKKTNQIVTLRNMVHNVMCAIIQGGGVDAVSQEKFLDIAHVLVMGLEASLPQDSHLPLDTWRICFESSRGLIAFLIISVSWGPCVTQRHTIGRRVSVSIKHAQFLTAFGTPKLLKTGHILMMSSRISRWCRRIIRSIFNHRHTIAALLDSSYLVLKVGSTSTRCGAWCGLFRIALGPAWGKTSSYTGTGMDTRFLWCCYHVTRFCHE